MTKMRWFTDAAYEEQADWDAILSDYRRHVEAIASSLPTSLAEFATEPRLNLHDADIRQVEIDETAGNVTIVVNTGNVELGYRELTLRFTDARIVPDNVQALAYAVGARYQTADWGDTNTTIIAQEIDRLPDGRLLVRLRLWPFYAFAVEFTGFELIEAPSGPHTGG